jgi:hypothetical protein
VKGGLSGSESKFEESVDFFDETEVVAEDVGERDLIKVLAVETQVPKEEEAGKHTVALCAVGTRVKTWNRALAADEAILANSNHPSCGTAKETGAAVTNEGGRWGLVEGVKNVEWGSSFEVDALE